MYSLCAKYYDKEFATVDELMKDVMVPGMDPNYEITLNGRGTGEMACDLLVF